MLAILCLNSGMNAAGGTTENADPMAVGGETVHGLLRGASGNE
jgi:hypothetical protein